MLQSQMGGVFTKCKDWEQLDEDEKEDYKRCFLNILKDNKDKDLIYFFVSTYDPNTFNKFWSLARFNETSITINYSYELRRIKFRLMSLPPYSLMVSWCKEVIDYPFVLQVGNYIALLRVQNLDTSTDK